MSLASVAAAAADWPGFRGAAGDGIAAETGVFDAAESIGLEPVWNKDYKEQFPDPLNPVRVVTTLLGPDMEIAWGRGALEMSSFAMPGWKAPAHLAEPDPARRGRIESRELESATLEATVTLDVYLPAGYDGGDGRYPVAYVHGGETAIEHGELPRSLDNLIGSRVEPLVAVFVKDVRASSDKYAAMVAEELIPFVDRNYRSVAAPEARAHVGAGGSGYTALYCAFKSPELDMISGTGH